MKNVISISQLVFLNANLQKKKTMNLEIFLNEVFHIS